MPLDEDDDDSFFEGLTLPENTVLSLILVDHGGTHSHMKFETELVEAEVIELFTALLASVTMSRRARIAESN